MRRCAGAAPLLAALSVVAHNPAPAASWTLERAFDTRLAIDDNPDFAPQPPGARTTLRVDGSVGLLRDDEAVQSRFDARLGAEHALRGDGGRTPVESNVTASHAWRDALTQWRLGGALLHESIGDGDPGDAADQRLGRGTRRSVALDLGGSRAVGERLTLSADARAGRTAYGAGVRAAQDFDTRSLSSRVTWRASERSALAVSAGASNFRTRPDARSRSRSAQLTLSATHAWSETVSLSALLGSQRSTRRSLVDLLVCPLPAAFCESGAATPVRVQLAGRSRDDALLSSAGWQWALDERRSAGLSFTRTQSPSGAGVPVISQRLSASTAQALSPTLSWTAGLDVEHLRYAAGSGAAGSPRPTLAVVAGSLRWQLAERVAVQAGARWARSGEARSDTSARSRQFTLAVRFDAPRAWSGV